MKSDNEAGPDLIRVAADVTFEAGQPMQAGNYPAAMHPMLQPTIWNNRYTRKRWLIGLLAPLRRALLWLALGPRGYDYMASTLTIDKRITNARMVDIVVRKDAMERRFEADWLKRLAAVVVTPKRRAARERFEAEDKARGGRW